MSTTSGVYRFCLKGGEEKFANHTISVDKFISFSPRDKPYLTDEVCKNREGPYPYREDRHSFSTNFKYSTGLTMTKSHSSECESEIH